MLGFFWNYLGERNPTGWPHTIQLHAVLAFSCSAGQCHGPEACMHASPELLSMLRLD
jgi:hypothetical protein